MTARLSVGMLLLLALMATGCANVAEPAPRATQVPNVRCFDQPPAGSPVQDPYARPMFFFFCMQGP
jgi:PBP1b-binding outer membrane lipoprotein LpoB